MQSAGLGNPPGQDRGETSPSHLCALAATDKDAPPQPANATLKDAQVSRVSRNGMVLVVAQHNLSNRKFRRGSGHSASGLDHIGRGTQSPSYCPRISLAGLLMFIYPHRISGHYPLRMVG
jgi:hypothetical protein